MSEPVLNLLNAFPYTDKKVIDLLNGSTAKFRFVLDSGAFTAWKAGKPIQLDDYCRFIESMPFHPWRYFTLDVIGDPRGTIKNYETMLKRGFKPIPIFTRGEDPSVLNDYYKTSDVVGIGGLVATEGNQGFVKGIMKHVAGRRVHLLGFTRHKFLTTFKPYMADSSSWHSASRFGRLKLYLGRGRFISASEDDCARPSREIENAMYNLGFYPAEFRKSGSSKGRAMAVHLSAASHIRYSLDVMDRLGTHLFLVINISLYGEVLLEAFDRVVNSRRYSQ